ncbi:DUF6484 domain-containing protein [Caballeronia sp. J97]|uniref:DUF6484 domain-containing protein n=1 Tax=Caballeronia sp. J97 TaxID=2805429 RepID=UPI002AB028F4|nr:DUF6484 domain-containing protein [Caballeronia sp. J97]
MSGRDVTDALLSLPGLEETQSVTGGIKLALGELVGLADDGLTALVVLNGEADAAARAARTMIELHERHIGRTVALLLENADPMTPIVFGVLREASNWPEDGAAGRAAATVEADGERLVVTAKERLVLRCGSASIILTRSGSVLIQGDQVLSRARAVNRIKGGSVHIN